MKKLLLSTLIAAAFVNTLLLTQPTHAAVANWQKGISMQSRYSTDFGSAAFKQSVDNAQKTGVNYITLVIPVHQDNIHSSTVYAAGDTPTDAAITSGVSYIQSKGMNVGLVMHDNPNDGQWRALISAGDKNMWFASYGSLLNHYASLAQSSGVKQLIIGTELTSMTVPNTSQWIGLIQGVRARFSGSVTYSAQHAGYMSDAQSLGFWSSLDKIGISAYYGLGNNTSQQAQESAWNNWNQQEVSVLASKYNKPIIFTEVGFVSRDGTLSDPGSAFNLNTPINTDLQATAYKALFNYWDKVPAMQGVFLWDWSTDPNAGGNNDGGYTPQNKPAEAVMKAWFGGGSTTPTPPVPPTVPQSFTVSTTAPSSVTLGSQTSAVLVASAAATSDSLVDVEVYNAQGQRIAQQFYEHQNNLGTTAKTFTINWNASAAGAYTIKAGVFNANWQGNLYWNDALKVITATANSTPTPPTPPPSSTQTNISVWWPSNGSTVSGVQPFKAAVDGRDLGTYDMFWQVDGGTLNKMGDSSTDGPHKESLVNLTGWSWSATKKYTITFVAKDKNGTVLSQKSVVITIY